MDRMEKGLGLYLHIPFCRGKCPYCDFYSVAISEQAADDYCRELSRRLSLLREQYSERKLETLYIGGGTPSALGANRLSALVRDALASLDASEDIEVTVELNPSDAVRFTREECETLRKSGVNRVSMGLQSSDGRERRLLGRRGEALDAQLASEQLLDAGIGNLSLDLMLGIPAQTRESIKRSVDFCRQCGAKHISAYILKLEPNTPFYTTAPSLELPDDDECAQLYLFACEALKSAGYGQYEISNFSLGGFESRHNLKYWSCEEYLGLGPAAHSFVDGKRFFFERNLDGFLGGAIPVPDGEGGDFAEYVMLRLRLADGLDGRLTRERFGYSIPPALFSVAEKFAKNGLVRVSTDSIALTREGFLLSNRIIGAIVDEI